MLPPAQRMPYRQLSIPASSQSADTSSSSSLSASGKRDDSIAEGGEPMVAETTDDRPKMTKVMSSEDEVARLTIEVCTSSLLIEKMCHC